MLSVCATRRLLLILLTLFLMGLPALPTAAQTCLPNGDVNEDGTLTPADALRAFQQFLGRAQPPLTDCQQVRANVFQSQNSAITPADALCILQQFLTLPSCFPLQPLLPDGTAIQFLVNTPHPLTLGLVNAEGQPVPAAQVSFQITAGDGALSATTVLTDAAGQATTVLTVGATPGLNVVEAHITGLVPVVFTITGVVAEQVRGTVAVSGNTQAAPPGTMLDVPFVVRAEDEFGRPVAGVEVTVNVRGAGAEIVPQPTAPAQGQGSLAVRRQNESTTAVAITDARGEARFIIRGVVGTEDIVAEVTVLGQVIEVPIVLNGILLAGPAGEIEGRVVDFVTRLGLDTVDLDFIDSSGRPVGSTQSDGSGLYSLRLPAGAILVMASRAGFISTTVDVEVIADTRTVVDVIALVPESASLGSIGGMIRNAVTNGGIADVTIDLRPGVNNTTDQIVASTRTDSVGVYAFSNLPAGTYTARLTRDGFEPNTFTVIVVGGTFTGGQDGTLSPVLLPGEVRIILAWGATPSDLDAHLTGPKPAGTPAPSNAACSSDPTRFHLFFPCAGNSSPFPADFTLDLDDLDGEGPETITLTRRLPGIYRYSVHDFTNRLSNVSTALSNSGARVRVFIGGGEPRTFNVPPGMPGTVWTVFELDGQTGAITPINQFRFESDAANIGSF